MAGLITGGLLLLAPAFAGEVSLGGRVLDENNAGVAGARITLRSTEPAGTFETVAGPTGLFHLSLPGPGKYLAQAQQTGFFPLKEMAVEVTPEPAELHLVLNHLREVFANVNVTAEPARLDVTQTSSQQTLGALEILDVPYPSTHDLRNAMKLMPGVVQDAGGAVHFNGSAENQVLYTLDGFNIGDPLTGTFASHLSIDSVRSMEFSAGRYSPEFGKGSAGTLAIRTDMGTDQFHPTATNFVPGVDAKKGLHIGSWTPRFGLSGPILKGRAWFADNVDWQYDTTVIDGLPKGADRTTSFRASNLLHNQVNLTPGNILFGDFLINYWNAPGTGLSALDPPPTTLNQRSRTWFYSVKDQMYLARDTLLEFGFGQNRTFARQIPQGDAFYQITPNGRSGNYFADTTQDSRRDQFLANLFLPALHFHGRHQFKLGLDIDRLYFHQDTRRTGYELFGLSGALIRRTTFGGSGVFDRPSLEASSYFLDNWRLRENLVLDLGVRQDWDELVSRILLSPRAALSWAPLGSQSTKLTGGYAVVYDATNLQIFARPLDQYAISAMFNADGSPQAPPGLTVFTIRNRRLAAPLYRNWTFGLEQRITPRLDLSVNLLRKRGSDGFSYMNMLQPGSAPPPDLVEAYGTTRFDAIYNLQNFRRETYDSAEFTVHHSFGERYEWMASYTRSRALSNAVLDISVEQPLEIDNNSGRMSWDSPNRVLSWGYLPTPWKNWAISYMLEARDGFPFSIERDTGELIGKVNSYRLPLWFNLNFHVERRFRWRGYRFALRGGFNNITNHNNYTLANNMYGAPGFLQYYGSDGRHFVVRIRWLGKE